MLSRELRNLSSALPDGERGLDGRREAPPSERLRRLFHSGPAKAQSIGGGRHLQPVHSEPNVYLVHHFLSETELEHMDSLITDRRASFKQSKTDDAGGGTSTHEVETQERTSARSAAALRSNTDGPDRQLLTGPACRRSLHLPKGGDTSLRSIEARAAELVGLPPDYVEPLQVVTYTNGQRFDLHHDLGPISLADDEDAGDQRLLAAQASEITVEAPTGPKRLVTLFVYLNTLPEGVGHTEFPQIGLSVRARHAPHALPASRCRRRCRARSGRRAAPAAPPRIGRPETRASSSSAGAPAQRDGAPLLQRGRRRRARPARVPPRVPRAARPPQVRLQRVDRRLHDGRARCWTRGLPCWRTAPHRPPWTISRP